MSESLQVAKYKITGLVDYFDEQGVVAGQFPIGSEQELPVSVGQKHVEDGNAELIDGSEEEVETEDASNSDDAGDDENGGADDADADTTTSDDESGDGSDDQGDVLGDGDNDEDDDEVE